MKLKIILRSIIVIALFVLGGIEVISAQQIVPQKKEQWHGFEKINFLLNGIPAYYVKPRMRCPVIRGYGGLIFPTGI